MTVLLHPYDQPEQWVEAFAVELPTMAVSLWPTVDDPAAIEYLVAWHHPAEDLRRYRNLRAILATGAGIDQFLDPGYPDVPIVRLADPAMAVEMAGYAVHWVLHFHRRFDRLLERQTEAAWSPESVSSPSDFRVGVLGFGTIGRTVGDAFRQLGYEVNAWSRTDGDTPGVEHFVGLRGLDSFLRASDAVINVLPTTSATRGLLDARRFAQFRPHATLVNVGRGSTVNEGDLVAALDAGHLSAAVLDVTAVEPLPAQSSLWGHPRVRITPHIAGDTRPASAAALIAANIQRIENGKQPFPMYSRSRGY